jgi:hypothetical protein
MRRTTRNYNPLGSSPNRGRATFMGDLLLKPSEFKVVALGYFALNAGRSTIEEAMATNTSTDDNRRVWASDSADFNAAADILRIAAWSAEERKDLAQKVTEP